MAWGYGLKNGRLGTGNLYVGNIDNGEYILVRNVDFGSTKPRKFEVCAASAKKGGVIELRIGSPEGALIGKVKIKASGSADNYTVSTASVKGVDGLCDLCLVFRGSDTTGDLFRLDWWRFIK